MIYLTGSTGFVGSAIRLAFKNEVIIFHKRGLEIKFDSASVVLNLAGKAHDLKNINSPDEYYIVNTSFTKSLFNTFLSSNAKVFITISSVKAVADQLDTVLLEDTLPNPVTHYGISKLLAEEYILSKKIPKDKKVYILRPCMIHGPGNRGNLNSLFKLVSKGIPWPLASFENKRSFLSIENLCFVIKELIEREDIPSGIYNVADDEPLSTNELIGLIAQSQNRNPVIWNISKKFIKGVAYLGNKLHLPLNTERLQKLTSSYVVSNTKIKTAIGKPLPVSSREGLLKTFKSFNSK